MQHFLGIVAAWFVNLLNAMYFGVLQGEYFCNIHQGDYQF